MTGPLPDGADRTALPEGMDPAFARSVRFWSRAYPSRWRAARGDELLGLLADLAAPGARRLDARSAADLVRAGWATRLREHPPLGPWLLYRLADRRMPGHLPWVADDIAGHGYLVRFGFAFVAMFLVATAALNLGAPLAEVFDLADAAIVVAGWLAGSVFQGPYLRRRARETHLVPRPGEPVRPGAMVRVAAPRRRLTARAGLPWLAGGLIAVLGACVAAAALAAETVSVEGLPPGEGFGFGVEYTAAVPRSALLGALALATAAGLVMSIPARRRLRAAQPPDQPHRVLVGARPRTVLRALLAVAVACAPALAEVLGAVPLALSLPIGLTAGVLAPTAAVAWAAVRRSPSADDLAAVDAWHVALTGRCPRVENPTWALAPAAPELVGVVQPWPWSNEGPTAALG